ncbi:MAG: FAD:protein FMN transferase [Planctomycetaceae bacterium]|nr:FAD:protein FMN transferase [Planctomycetaceae bacterium]
MSDSAANRRDFLTGRALASAAEAAGNQVADALVAMPHPGRGPTLLLRTSAMGTDFDVLLNPDGPSHQVGAASEALDEIVRLDEQYSVYRAESELSTLNRLAAEHRVEVEQQLFRLLRRGCALAQQTEGAFNPIAGQLIELWRRTRREERAPTESERRQAIEAARLDRVEFDDARSAVRFSAPGPRFDLGAIGKGYAVDRAAEILVEQGVENWLVHGGKSSARVRGCHVEHDGWPIALQNPLLPDRRFLTLILRDMAMSTSGTAVQWYRHQGKRYGHILDPRTGWPVEVMLSVSVIAPDAALADALSTAFFVLGVEKALSYCDNFENVGVILFPLPDDGRTLAPIIRGVPQDRLYFADPA